MSVPMSLLGVTSIPIPTTTESFPEYVSETDTSRNSAGLQARLGFQQRKEPGWRRRLVRRLQLPQHVREVSGHEAIQTVRDRIQASSASPSALLSSRAPEQGAPLARGQVAEIHLEIEAAQRRRVQALHQVRGGDEDAVVSLPSRSASR